MSAEVLSLRSPGELLAIVPYLLGFQPSDSIMCICLKDSRIGLTQRLDLPPAGQALLVEAMMPSLTKERPDQVLLIAYEDAPDRSVETLDALTSVLMHANIAVHDRIVVRHGMWRSLDCHEPSCCPADGQPVLTPADVPELASEFVGHEQSPHVDRDSLVAQLEAGPDAATAVDLEDVRAPTREERMAVWPHILDAADEPVQITPAMAVAAAESLTDVQLRDGLVAWLTPGALDTAELPEAVQSLVASIDREWDEDQPDTGAIVAMNRIQARLIRLCALLPDEHSAAALTLLACFAWWRGNGVLTRGALDRALRCQPDYRLALLLERMVDLAIHPRR